MKPLSVHINEARMSSLNALLSMLLVAGDQDGPRFADVTKKNTYVQVTSDGKSCKEPDWVFVK